MSKFDYSLLKSVGNDVVISPNAEFRRPQLVSIGNHVAIDTAYITTAADIGDYVHIGPYVSIIGGPKAHFTMGNFTNLAAGCRVVCVSDKHMGDGLIGPATIPDQYKDELDVGQIVMKSFANVGTNSVILPGVTLAEGTVIGACSLVTKNTEPWTIYTGIPAKPVMVRPREKMLRYAQELGYPAKAGG